MILVRFGQHMDAFGPHYLPVLNIDYLAFQCHKECFNYLYQLYVVIINFFIDTGSQHRRNPIKPGKT